jgi:hypothetical protein
LAKFEPTTVKKDAPNVNVFDGDSFVKTQKSNEKDAVNDVKRSCEASGSIARVATTFNPYEAPVIMRGLTLESEIHCVDSQADPPNVAAGE